MLIEQVRRFPSPVQKVKFFGLFLTIFGQVGPLLWLGGGGHFVIGLKTPSRALKTLLGIRRLFMLKGSVLDTKTFFSVAALSATNDFA